LIPDFIPVLVTPGGLWLAIRMISPEVLEEARGNMAGSGLERSVGYVGAVIILLVWTIILIGIIYLIPSLAKGL
jgi:hypothetical protein